MNRSTTFLALAIGAAVMAFSFTTLDIAKKEIKTDSSSVVWKAYKVTGSHVGTVNITSGSLEFSGDKLSGGEFTIDMTSITCTDLEGEYKGKLEGHLKSDDFFGVETYPKANLILTKVKSTGKNSYEATGDLTIKGKTNPVSFDLSIYGSKANATLKIDRTLYDVKYGSTAFFDGLKDSAIYDEFDLVVDVEF